jgi:hypothetical protein
MKVVLNVPDSTIAALVKKRETGPIDMTYASLEDLMLRALWEFCE